ncbi:hypothetical protein Mycch_5685 (plasmid) [Mycolicibacterium chubuense NBB4]|uniref:Uncharacterized protein n=1 Tax=Mycolicibacterium chubuense (strain NBB4) TaxID=710421 RepID=I4BSR3_MYCCN|nr:hypothetical protein Mycch_5685 [Mycolicibacterium chubuense NBB4]
MGWAEYVRHARWQLNRGSKWTEKGRSIGAGPVMRRFIWS